MHKRADHFLYVALLALCAFPSLFLLRALDDNRLTSWQWVFQTADAGTVYLALVAGITASYLASGTSLFERRPAVSLFILSFTAAALFWTTPETIVDAARYFSQAKHLEVYGTASFLEEWGKGIMAWTDLPLVPFLYGLIFTLFGESRLFIQIGTTALFSLTVVLTYLVGRDLWDRTVGLYAGLLLLGIPYLFSQVPLMLVDVPVMFFLMLSVFTFIRALSRGGTGLLLASSITIFLAFYTKYSLWIMLSLLPVILLVRLAAAPSSSAARGGEGAEALPQVQRGLVLRRAVLIASFALLMIGTFYCYKMDVFSGQLQLLMQYQRPGLKRWGESFASTFLFQTHPFITAAALYSMYAAFKKKDVSYIIACWLLLLVVGMQIRRIRYLIMAFPMLALMASYGLREIRERRLAHFIVWCAVASSLVVAGCAYLPFLHRMSAANLKDAGEFLDTLEARAVDVYTLPVLHSPVNTTVAVPLLDLFTAKSIRHLHEPGESAPPGDVATSPLRFTWEYVPPPFYSETPGGSERQEKAGAVVVIGEEPGQLLPDRIKRRTGEHRKVKAFERTENIFQHRTVVTVYYD
ncbi:MAG: glycosyltransferase family 39 protein [Nitrospirota bacterium]